MINITKSFFTNLQDLEKLKVQEIGEGLGPVVEKYYEVEIPVQWEELLVHFDNMRKDINEYAPTFLGKYYGEGSLEITEGKRLLVDMLGPYNAPIKAAIVTPIHIRLATLQNHPEAGYVEFFIQQGKNNRFIAHSFSRAADMVFNLGFNYLHLASYIQNKMWKQFAKNFYRKIKGRDPKKSETSFSKNTFDYSPGQTRGPLVNSLKISNQNEQK